MEQLVTDSVVEDSFFEEKAPVKVSHFKTRVFSFIALTVLASSCAYVGHEGYYIVSDGFAAPFILGPDNDLVVQSSLKMAEVKLEKGRDISEQKAIEASLEDSERAIIKLDSLKELGKHALAFTDTTTRQQVSIGGSDLVTLAGEKKALYEMQERQALLTGQAKKDYEAGTITQMQYQQQQQALDQIQVALFNNDHVKMQTDVLLGQATLGLQSLIGSQNGNNSMPMPAILTAADLMGRIEIQRLQVDALMKTELAEKERVDSELSDIAVLEKQIMSRPIFAAMGGDINAAFVPYDQSKGVVSGTSVYDCIWGLFACKNVGSVRDVIKGESSLIDPVSGSQSRGIYITLNVNDAEAMQKKILRVRP